MTKLNRFQTRPKVASIPLHPCLSRLRIPPERPSLVYLRQIHRAFRLQVPTENLDIYFRKDLKLDIWHLIDKIIYRHRGGIGIEVNYLFYHLLNKLGFDTYLASAQWYDKNNEKYGSNYDHMILIVVLDDEYHLCDVGTIHDHGIIYPKRLVENELQVDGNRYFRFQKDADENYILQNTSDMLHFETIYRFNLQEREPIEFIDRLHYYQSDPDSPFTGKRILRIITEGGSKYLDDEELVINELGALNTIKILNEDDLYAKMEEHFGISYQSLLHT